MAARVCTKCDLKLPNQHRFGRCPVCDENTTVQFFEAEQKDWQVRVSELQQPLVVDEAYQNEVDWRLYRFKRMGLDHDIACHVAAKRELTGGYTVDLEEFRKLLERGATPTQAARILG